MALIYAGIGSRRTPDEVLWQMDELGTALARAAWTLRSGGAPGADQAFEAGCDRAAGAKEIFVPWSGFEGRISGAPGVYVGVGPRALELAKLYHPAWDRCSRGAQLLHGRNGYQVLGWRLDNPCTLVICWTPDGRLEGGTAQALRIAQAFKIPVMNLGCEQGQKQRLNLLKELAR